MDPSLLVFDAGEGRALVGGLVLPRAVRERLARLEARGEHEVLRLFATSCVERIIAPHDDHARALLDAASSGSNDARADARSVYRGAAMAATTVGLKHGLPGAATFLAAFEAANPDAALAARGAARMEILYARLSGGEEADVETRQLAWLEAQKG